MKNITKYFRNAISAYSQGTIDYKNIKNYIEISFDELEQGVLQTDINTQWLKETNGFYDKKKKAPQDINAIIALKTIATEYVDGTKKNINVEEMTSVFFVPVIININGVFSMPTDGKLPWIPREYLEPMEEPQISIGNIQAYDDYLEKTTDERKQIDSWGKHLDYAKKMYEKITGNKFNEKSIKYRNHIDRIYNDFKTDGKYYIFSDSTVNSTYHILNLYNDILSTTSQEKNLYSKIISGEIKPTKESVQGTSVKHMKRHLGQMAGEYPLSPTQREAVHSFTEIENGEILAVSGPPGTGKTTLLQSVVANMYVERALNGADAPIIVASSTNNQAVTNIIDSFGKINVVDENSNLEQKWITGSNSFATYFPSVSKKYEASKNAYQYTDCQGNNFFEKIESNENMETSKTFFRSEYTKYFGVEVLDLHICKNVLQNELKKVSNLRENIILNIEDIQNIIGQSSYEDFITETNVKIKNNKLSYEEITKQIDIHIEQTERLRDRLMDWNACLNKLPLSVRLLKNLEPSKTKIQNIVYTFMKDDELEFLNRNMNLEEIQKAYNDKIKQYDIKFYELQAGEKKLLKQNNELNKAIRGLETYLDKVKNECVSLSKYGITIAEKTLQNFDAYKINEKLDRLRYIAFWFAVHYFECKWLTEDCDINENQKSSTFENVLRERYRRLSMISPCLVMTFFMLPKQFMAYDGNKNKSYYMYNYIDLLIIDEAGQISPEIAACSFSLAKKAVVVGDEQQIPPVWGTTRALDISFAKAKGVIGDKDEYRILEENGLNCSQSSIMKVASLSCAFGERGTGLFLSEHRRCYNEIIEYCNELVYERKLRPLRGSALDDDKNKLNDMLPVMGHYQIDVSQSQKVGCSRQNKTEAEKIVKWIQNNFPKIQELYADEVNTKTIIGVITPFKSQSYLIKKLIKEWLPNAYDEISVGTVHTFQGAEKKVIIFSSVYGNQDGCYFINNNPCLMNVAVSRAKDSFLVFGDAGCLGEDNSTPAGLLREMTRSEVKEVVSSM